MGNFEIAFKAAVDALKVAAQNRKVSQYQSADIQCQAYCQAVDDVMRVYIDAQSEADDD